MQKIVGSALGVNPRSAELYSAKKEQAEKNGKKFNPGKTALKVAAGTAIVAAGIVAGRHTGVFEKIMKWAEKDSEHIIKSTIGKLADMLNDIGSFIIVKLPQVTRREGDKAYRDIQDFIKSRKK